MIIISANLNQRLGNPIARSRFESWLEGYSPDLVLSQEPFKPQQTGRPELSGYRMISTSPQISCWVAARLAEPTVIEHQVRWHEVIFAGLTVHNVYLSPNSAFERTNLLLEIAAAFAAKPIEKSVVLGDFNLAPTPADGMFGSSPSRFTTVSERKALATLQNSGKLTDTTCPRQNQEVEFTFERMQNGQHSRFRCDLALVSEELCGRTVVRYDHSVRRSEIVFTDHSAIVLDLQAVNPTPLAYLILRNNSSIAPIEHMQHAYPLQFRRLDLTDVDVGHVLPTHFLFDGGAFTYDDSFGCSLANWSSSLHSRFNWASVA